MLFYLGFLTALFIGLIAANYLLYIRNKKLIEENDSMIKAFSILKTTIVKLQDDVTSMKMKR